MDARGLGLILIWAGALPLVAVLQHRLRRGALGREGLDRPPPMERWQVPMAVTGLVLVAAGAALTLWAFASAD